MPALILALLLAVSIGILGWRALAYLFPYHSPKD